MFNTKSTNADITQNDWARAIAPSCFDRLTLTRCLVLRSGIQRLG